MNTHLQQLTEKILELLEDANLDKGESLESTGTQRSRKKRRRMDGFEEKPKEDKGA